MVYLILVGCCGGVLAVVIGRAAPLRVENNAIPWQRSDPLYCT